MESQEGFQEIGQLIKGISWVTNNDDITKMRPPKIRRCTKSIIKSNGGCEWL